eukprot:1643496-Karenia_brevis.AAC.1
MKFQESVSKTKKKICLRDRTQQVASKGNLGKTSNEEKNEDIKVCRMDEDPDKELDDTTSQP